MARRSSWYDDVEIILTTNTVLFVGTFYLFRWMVTRNK